MSYHDDMQGDVAPVLAVFNGAFAGHIRRDAVIAERYPRGAFPWLPRATLNMLLWPEHRRSKCGVVDLLDPSEWDCPRCGDPECRCSLRDAAMRHDLLQYFRTTSPTPQGVPDAR